MSRNPLTSLANNFSPAWNNHQENSVLNKQAISTEEISVENTQNESTVKRVRKNSRRSSKTQLQPHSESEAAVKPTYPQLSLKNLSKQDKRVHRVTLDLEPKMYQELNQLAQEANQTKAKFLRAVLDIAFAVIREES